MPEDPQSPNFSLSPFFGLLTLHGGEGRNAHLFQWSSKIITVVMLVKHQVTLMTSTRLSQEKTNSFIFKADLKYHAVNKTMLSTEREEAVILLEKEPSSLNTEEERLLHACG